jgi:hypothetical protein
VEEDRAVRFPEQQQKRRQTDLQQAARQFPFGQQEGLVSKHQQLLQSPQPKSI